MNTSPNLWGGEFVQGLNTALVLSANDITGGLWRIEEGIKDKAVVKLFNYVSSLQAGNACTVTPSASGSNMSDLAIDLTRFTINEDVCKNDFNNTSYADSLASGALNTQIPREVLEAYLMDMANNEAANTMRLRWMGDTGSADPLLQLQDGIIKVVESSVGYISVTPTAAGASTDPSTVIAEINKALAAIPAAVRNNANFKIVVSPQIYVAYQQALANNTAYATWNFMFRDVNVAGSFKGNFAGTEVPLHCVNGLEGEIMLLGAFDNSKQGNIVLATDALADYASVQVTDLQPSTGQPFVNFLWSIGQGVNVQRPTEIVLYK